MKTYHKPYLISFPSLLFILFLGTCVRAQCPPDLDVVLTTQAEVDLHVLLYPNCTALEGLTLGDPAGSDINDISGFQQLAALGTFSAGAGNLTIENTQLTDLTGLENLDIIQSIIIRNNPLLTTLMGMDDDTPQNSINLTIENNPQLAECSIELICNTIRRQFSSSVIIISGNTGNCNDEEVITAPCLAACHPDLPWLRSFYNSTNGFSWDDNSGWSNTSLSNCNPCNWFGVTCNADDRVIEIDMNLNGLFGTLPTLNWEVMTELEVLKIRGSSFTPSERLAGPIPAALFDLPSIREIDFTYHNFDAFPANLHHAATLEQLRLFAVSNLQGAFPVSVAGMDALEVLDITNTDLSGPLPADLFSLPNLRDINLTNNEFSGQIPPNMASAPRLEDVRLTSNNFTSWDPVSGLNGNSVIKRFFLSQSGAISGTLPSAPFTGTTALQDFTLRIGITGALPHFPDATNMRVYIVNFANLSSSNLDLNIANAPNLLSLNISDNNLTGPVPDLPTTYTQLESLNLSFNAFTGELNESFNNPALQRIRLNDNQLTGLLPAFFGDFNW
ncbi:MAG: hypothetical protein AAF840_06990, partial [Bacteroidota bacterium]